MWRDRIEAGQALAKILKSYAGPDVIIAGIPRGGVIVAAQVSTELGLPLDIVVTRKLGAPGNPEFGIGAVAADGETVIDRGILDYLGVSDSYLEQETAEQLRELKRRDDLYRHGAPPADWTGKTVILVDDGIATGVTTRASALYARRRGAKTVIVAAPVAPIEAKDRLRDAADDFVFLETPAYFPAVGAFYDNFSQTTDEEVKEALSAR